MIIMDLNHVVIPESEPTMMIAPRLLNLLRYLVNGAPERDLVTKTLRHISTCQPLLCLDYNSISGAILTSAITNIPIVIHLGRKVISSMWKHVPSLSHSKSISTLPKVNEGEEKTEDFREVRSRLRKTSSLSPAKPPLKLSPDPQTRPERVSGLGHHSPPARLETTTGKEDVGPPPQEEHKANESKGKEKEAPKLIRAKTDHNKCIEDNGWRPPAPISKDHDKCIEDIGPTKPPAIPKDHNQCLEEPRGRTREQSEYSTIEAPRDHAPRSVKEPPRESASGPDEMASTDHDCEWKDKYLTLQADVDARGRPGSNIGLEGLTIILHMQGRDDLVINTDLRSLE
ncbi:hypothetical protein N0V82_001226 [Gnomoniopsis sp. IMI 355080]|nr:hypothetical protein N0V82_001226 [Gnomoniopsis sp. IMI 355080]